LVVRLATHDRSRTMMQAAAEALWPYTGELFETMPSMPRRSQRIGFESAALREPWLAYLEDVFQEATLTLPSAKAWMQSAAGKAATPSN